MRGITYIITRCVQEMEFDLLLKSHSEEKARELLRDRYSLQGSQKPFLVLHDVKSTPHTRVKKKTRKSTANKQLSSFLAKGDPTYTLYAKLNTFWNQYIDNVMASSNNHAQTMLSADWHGAYVSVKASKNPTFVKLQGILLWESRNQLLLVTKKNCFKQVPKHGTVFELIRHHENLEFNDTNEPNNEIEMKRKGERVDANENNESSNNLCHTPGEAFVVIGDRVQCRSTERTTRKFKPHDVSDLVPLCHAFW